MDTRLAGKIPGWRENTRTPFSYSRQEFQVFSFSPLTDRKVFSYTSNMRTTKKPGQPITGLATVTEITINKGGRPRHEPTFITEDVREGALIRDYRNFLSIPSGALAEAVGISQSTLSNYESGFKHIPDARVEQIAAALGIEAWKIRIIQTLPLNLKAA